MLNLQQVSQYYPKGLQSFPEFILREYLQYKILDYLYDSPFGNQLVFLGGTCLRIVHENTRFSEDLDFDNLGLKEDDFSMVGEHIAKSLELEGYEVEIKTVFAGAFHCHIKFPALLYQEGLSGHREQKILIQLDTEPQHFDYQPKVKLLNKFDVFATIQTTPLDVLLSQKFYAILNRVRNKGRDFFDVSFLLGLGVKPNYSYLSQKKGIDNFQDLKERIIEHCESIDMEQMAKDVQPFLFQPKDVKKVLLFKDYVKQVEL